MFRFSISCISPFYLCLTCCIMSAHQVSMQQQEKGSGNPFPKRGQIKVRIFNEIISAVIGGSHNGRDQGAQTTPPGGASASVAPVRGPFPVKWSVHLPCAALFLESITRDFECHSFYWWVFDGLLCFCAFFFFFLVLAGKSLVALYLFSLPTEMDCNFFFFCIFIFGFVRFNGFLCC